MNRPVRTLSVFCLLLFLALMANITYIQFFKADEYNANAANRRVLEESFSRERGAILAGKFEIAKSVASDDNYEWQRTYTQPYMYAPITGFLSFSYGQTGLEKTQNSILSGDDEQLFTTRMVDLVTNKDPKGGIVETTIDPKVQAAAFNGLRSLGEGVQGAAVAIEPSTGRVLGMASTPSWDPNTMASHDLEATEKTWNDLNNKEKNPGQPMLNRSTQTTLPPGSTFKLVTAAAAMENLDMTPDSEVPYSGASLDLPQSPKSLPNESGGACPGPTLQNALEYSCNTSFGSLGIELTGDQLANQADRFGFGQRYLTDLPSQAVSRFSNEDPSEMDAPFRAYSAIGQYEVAATPLQMAMVSAGIANGGTVMKPYLVDKVRSASLDVLSEGDPEEIANQPAVSSQTASDLTDMMESVVEVGTGTPAQIPGVAVAGKTGTAQSTPSRPPYAWFTSFAPADDPQVAVAVLVQSSSTARSEIAGGRLAAPTAKAMMEAVINE